MTIDQSERMDLDQIAIEQNEDGNCQLRISLNTIVMIIALLAQFGAIVWWTGRVETRLTTVEEWMKVKTPLINDSATTAAVLQRIESRLTAMDERLWTHMKDNLNGGDCNGNGKSKQ